MYLQSAVAVCERIRAQSFFRGHREIQFAVVCDVTRLLFLPFYKTVMFPCGCWLYIQSSSLLVFCFFLLLFSSHLEMMFFFSIFVIIKSDSRISRSYINAIVFYFHFCILFIFIICQKCWYCDLFVFILFCCSFCSFFFADIGIVLSNMYFVSL